MERKKGEHVPVERINQVVQEIYLRRYELALNYDFRSLSAHYCLPDNTLKKELRRQFAFDFTAFRRLLLGSGVFFLHKKLGKTQAETAEVLKIHIDTVKKICRETRYE